DAVVLLGEVDQVEVAAERPGDLLRALHGEGVDQRLGGLDRVGPVLLVGGDGQRAQALDVLEQVRADRLGQDAAEHLAEQSYVRAQLVRHLVAGATAVGVGLGGGGRKAHLPHCSSWIRAGPGASECQARRRALWRFSGTWAPSPCATRAARSAWAAASSSAAGTSSLALAKLSSASPHAGRTC